MTLLTLKSIFLVCSNLHRSLLFYKKIGFQELRSGDRYSVLSAGPELELHLHVAPTKEEQERYGVGPGPGSPSLVLAYETTDIRELAKKLPAQNILAEPQTTPWGASILMVSDPDGNRLEFRERTEF